jgi:hypothetical protein
MLLVHLYQTTDPLKFKMLLLYRTEGCSVAGHVISSIHCHYVLFVFCIIVLPFIYGYCTLTV